MDARERERESHLRLGWGVDGGTSPSTDETRGLLLTCSAGMASATAALRSVPVLRRRRAEVQAAAANAGAVAEATLPSRLGRHCANMVIVCVRTGGWRWGLCVSTAGSVGDTVNVWVLLLAVPNKRGVLLSRGDRLDGCHWRRCHGTQSIMWPVSCSCVCRVHYGQALGCWRCSRTTRALARAHPSLTA